MVHMMNADVSAEPAQQGWQIVIRASVQRCVLLDPCSIAFPERVLELVLDIEQPDPDGGGKQHDRKMHDEEGLDADEPDEHRDDECDRGVGCHGAEPWLPSGAEQANRKPLLQDKEERRADPEEHDRMPVNPISQAPPP